MPDIEVTIQDGDDLTVVITPDADTIEVAVEDEVIAVEVTDMGPQGPKGDKGDPGESMRVEAGQDISGGRVVYIQSGKAYYYDPSDVSLAGRTIGVTTGAALQGSDVTIQLSGLYYHAGLGLTPDTVYYIGAAGVLTASTTGLKVVQPVGVSITADKLIINIVNPIITN